MSIHRKLTTVCCAAVLALGLAACGSDDDKVVTAPPIDTNGDGIEPTTLKIATELAGRLESVDVAESLANAIKYAGMLSSEDVNGDSAMATANAEMVLTAETAINDAVTAADTAIKEANAAKLAAEDIENEAEKDAVMRLLDDAIETAMEVKTAAQTIIDDTGGAGEELLLNTLGKAVAAVEGDGDMPNTAADVGEAVADLVRTALATTITPGEVGNAPMGAIRNDGADIGAMKWADIVGAANVMDVRRLLAGSPSSLTEVEAMSAAGTAVTDLVAADGPAVGGEFIDGASAVYAAVYKGIGGTLFCAGSDCDVNANGNLTGGWYFTPADGDELYIADSAEAGSYMAAVMYAQYGYWLTYGVDGSPTGVATYAAKGHADTNTENLDLTRGADATTDVTATYTGDAVGIAVRDETSGQFTADVTLTATFGASPMLGGTISGFDGKAANPEWNVMLKDTTIVAAGSSTGVAYGGTAEGAWTAQGYGPAQTEGDDPVMHRPEGFFGAFDANFSDGAAAGAYATRNAE